MRASAKPTLGKFANWRRVHLYHLCLWIMSFAGDITLWVQQLQYIQGTRGPLYAVSGAQAGIAAGVSTVGRVYCRHLCWVGVLLGGGRKGGTPKESFFFFTR